MAWPRRFWMAGVMLCTVMGGVRAQRVVNVGVDRRDRPRIEAVSIDGGSIDIDGRLDESYWTSVYEAGTFTQRAPNSGAPSLEQTGVQVVYDDENIYVGLRLFDSAPDSIRSGLARRDVQVEGSDWAHVYIDSFHDRRSAFRFSVNPSGVKLDALHYADTEEDVDWNAVWEAASTIDSSGWTAEFRIPMSQLRFSTAVDQEAGVVWGINFGRELGRSGEQAFWAPIDVDDAGFVSQFGSVEGLIGLSAPSRFEIVPYTLSRLTRAPGDHHNPFYRSNDVGGAVGVDVRYGLTSDMTLSLTLNPDFGQVESDPSTVNLSAFETFLPEKRTFFLEGADLFRVTYPEWPPLIYSRRIGRSPRGSAPDLARFDDTPKATTILGAAKVTGKTSSGLSLGVMNAVTARETSTFVQDDGLSGAVGVEPLTSYSAIRVSQDFRDGGSSIGVIGSSTNRRIRTDDPQFLHTGAYLGGVDGRHRFGGGNFEAKGSVLGTLTLGSREAIARTQRSTTHNYQRPDAQHLEFDSLRTSLAGFQSAIDVSKIGGGHWRWSVAGRFMSPGFHVNDLGFQPMADQVTGNGSVTFQENHPSGPLRSWDLTLYQSAGWSTGGERQFTWSQLYGTFQFKNQWSVNAGVDRTHPFTSTEMLRGGPSLCRPGYIAAWLWLTGDPRSAVSVGGGVFTRLHDEGSGRFLNVQPEVRFRPSGNASITIQPTLRLNNDQAQYVKTFAGATDTTYVVGRLEQTTTSLTARVNYTFSPSLSLELYFQPFISRARYSGFRQVANPKAGTENERFSQFQWPAGDDRPDFNLKQLRSNLVVRWEYLPGSTLFVVWGQDRSESEPTGDFRLWRDARRLFDIAGTNVLLVKISYWLSS